VIVVRGPYKRKKPESSQCLDEVYDHNYKVTAAAQDGPEYALAQMQLLEHYLHHNLFNDEASRTRAQATLDHFNQRALIKPRSRL
jgi:hypothetical protein